MATDERLKVCSRCQLNLPESDFHRCRKSPDGRDYRCKTCKSVLQRLAYLEKPEYFKAAGRRRWQEHPDAVRGAMRRYWARRRAGIPAHEPRYHAEFDT
jgi:hypothetical protein